MALTYKDAGVSLEAAEEAPRRIAGYCKRTYGPRVLGGIGGFAGMFRLDYNERLFRRNFRNPILVACTDGVGTKLQVAIKADRLETVGIDLVAMSVNDLICTGAEPLFFLDYIAIEKLDPSRVAELVKGISDGCVEADCALLGGETAEHPGVMPPGEFDMAGFAVGVVERHRIVDPKRIEVGDSIIGLASSGVHSNGYSLVRKMVFEGAGLSVSDRVEALGETVGDALLRPTRIYVRAINSLKYKYRIKKVVKGMAHITGGGLIENVRRILPEGTSAHVRREKWPVPPVFDWLQKLGDVADAEMFRVFNMGIGLVLVVAPYYSRSLMAHLRRKGEQPYFLGKVRRGNGEVVLK
jgi:phosphoribosylformylglycinamidine cyclo-ligase